MKKINECNAVYTDCFHDKHGTLIELVKIKHEYFISCVTYIGYLDEIDLNNMFVECFPTYREAFKVFKQYRRKALYRLTEYLR